MRLLRRLSFLIYSMSRTRLETDVSYNSTLDCTNIVQKDGRVNSLAILFCCKVKVWLSKVEGYQKCYFIFSNDYT